MAILFFLYLVGIYQGTVTHLTTTSTPGDLFFALRWFRMGAEILPEIKIFPIRPLPPLCRHINDP
jgi:hypothetical protein